MKSLKALPKKILTGVGFTILGVHLLVSYQNCGQGFSAVSEDQHSISGPEIHRLEYSQKCLTDASFDACLYFKSPAASTGKSFQESTQTAALKQIQNWGIKFSEKATQGYLTNSHFTVRPVVNDFMTANTNGKFVFSVSDANKEKIKQLAAYAWLDRTFYLISKFGFSHYLKNQDLQVLLDTKAVGVSFADRIIALGSDDKSSIDWGWDGSLLVYLYTEYAIYNASNGKSEPTSMDTSHLNCTSKKNGQIVFQGCCAKETGCGKAISAGLADFWVNVVFEQNPGIGESKGSSGIVICGIPRSPQMNANIKFSQAYQSCKNQYDGDVGNVYALGSVFSSILYEILNKILIREDRDEWVKLVLDVMSQVEAKDDAVSFKSKLLMKDKDRYGAKFSQFINEEFSRRL